MSDQPMPLDPAGTDTGPAAPAEPGRGPDAGPDAGHPHGPLHADPVLDEVEAHADPAVVRLVHEARDRFGARGLRDMITLASYELEIAEKATAALQPDAADEDVDDVGGRAAG